MLEQKIRDSLNLAIKARKEVEKTILRVVLGESDKLNSGKQTTDEQLVKIIRKIIESNNECLASRENNVLKEENLILETLLPKSLNKEEIQNYLSEVLDKILTCKNEGQAIGLSVKFLKDKSLFADGNLVKEVVLSLRNT